MKYYLSFSLPKTGTTYFGNIIDAIGSPLSVSRIKEPSFFVDRKLEDKDCTSRIIARGNYTKGFRWYESLFSNQAHSNFDLSTQYWIQPDQSLVYALRHIDSSNLVAFSIRRDPIEQLVSYIGQLRRGYIQFDRLSSILNQDSSFAQYILHMYQWSCSDKSSIFSSHKVKFIEFDFDDLISDPLAVIKKLCELDLQIQNDGLAPVATNRRSTPRVPVINNLLFSPSLKNKLKAFTPDLLYPILVNLRKNIVRINLQKDSNSGSRYSVDKQDLQEFLECRY